jgi:hypothetical protein
MDRWTHIALADVGGDLAPGFSGDSSRVRRFAGATVTVCAWSRPSELSRFSQTEEPTSPPSWQKED